MHVRRGLKIKEEAKPFDLADYLEYVDDFYYKYFLLNPDQVDKVNKTIFLVTEDPQVLDQLKK